MPDSTDIVISISSAKVAIFSEICHTIISVGIGAA